MNRKELNRKRHWAIYRDYIATDEFGKAKYSLKEIREKYNLGSNQGIYYAISAVEKEMEKMKKDLTNDKK